MIQHREPLGEEIARHAYELYIQRGGEHGKDVDDWLKAKKELWDVFRAAFIIRAKAR